VAYTGNIARIALGDYGLLTDISPNQQPPSSLILANNIAYMNGAAQKAPGTIKWNATATSAGIIGVYHWRPTLVQSYFIAATSDGNIYQGRDRKFGSPINRTVASTLTPNCVFAEGGAEDSGNPKKLFFFTGGTTNPLVLKGNGTAFSTISTPSSDWTNAATYPKFGLVHRGSLWAFAGQMSYASSTTNHEDFSNTSAAYVSAVYPGEGGEVRGAVVYKGKLFCFKDGGFGYALNDSDTDTSNWYWQKIASNFGMSAPNAGREVLDDMIIGNTAGTLTSYQASQKLGGVEAGDIVQNAMFEAFLRGNTSKVGVPYQHTMWYPEKKQLFVTYRSSYQTHNDMLLMFDMARNGNPRAAFWKKGTPQCLGVYRDINQIDRPMYGDAFGFLHLMDAEDRTEGGAAYTGEFQTPHWDFSFVDPTLSSVEKHFDFIAVHYRPESSGNLSVDYFIDGRYIDTVTVPMIQYQRPELGTLLLSTDRLAQPNTETGIRQLRGTGRTLSIRCYNSGSNQSFQIAAVSVFFRAGGTKATQE